MINVRRSNMLVAVLTSFFLLCAGITAVTAVKKAEVSAETLWNGSDGTAIDAEYVFSGGDGSEAAPYLISTAKDLAQLAANVNGGVYNSENGYYDSACYALAADIELNDTSSYNT